MNTAIVKGSMADVMNRENLTLAESFLSCDVILIVDTSGSMGNNDAPGGKSRHDAALDELRHLQNTMPGKIAVVAFSDNVRFCSSGVPHRFGCGTDMAKALQFVKPADDTGVRFIMISDGFPNDEQETLRVARTFKSKIDCVYIGPELGSGRIFLDTLAAATGGRHVQAKEIGMLADPVRRLLLNGI